MARRAAAQLSPHNALCIVELAPTARQSAAPAALVVSWCPKGCPADTETRLRRQGSCSSGAKRACSRPQPLLRLGGWHPPCTGGQTTCSALCCRRRLQQAAKQRQQAVSRRVPLPPRRPPLRRLPAGAIIHGSERVRVPTALDTTGAIKKPRCRLRISSPASFEQRLTERVGRKQHAILVCDAQHRGASDIWISARTLSQMVNA